jgi:hypothetical protein
MRVILNDIGMNHNFLDERNSFIPSPVFIYAEMRYINCSDIHVRLTGSFLKRQFFAIHSFRNYVSVFAVFKGLNAYLDYILYLLVCLFRQTLLFWKDTGRFF